jgi:hypothetical protein
MRSHLRSPEEMNWSNTTCAPLAKSPNCASHIVERVRLRQGVAVFETEHRLFREHRVDDFVAGLVRRGYRSAACSGLRLLVDQHRVALARTCRARNPGPRGAPDCLPSSSVPNARCFGRRPVDPLPALDRLAAPSRKRWIVLWTLKPSGTSVIFCRSPCSTASARRWRRGADRPRRRDRLHAGPAAVEPVGLVRLVGLAGVELDLERAPLGLRLWSTRPLITPSDQLLRRSPASTVRADLRYISGWVKPGSSPSLWPKRR